MKEENIRQFADWCFSACGRFLNPHPKCRAMIGIGWETLMDYCPILNEIQRRWVELGGEE